MSWTVTANVSRIKYEPNQKKKKKPWINSVCEHPDYSRKAGWSRTKDRHWKRTWTRAVNKTLMSREFAASHGFCANTIVKECLTAFPFACQMHVTHLLRWTLSMWSQGNELTSILILIAQNKIQKPPGAIWRETRAAYFINHSAVNLYTTSNINIPFIINIK